LAVPELVRVVSEDLQMSAGTVDAHADDLRTRHATADGRIESAQRGVPAGSVAALMSAVAKWQGDSSALFGRLVDHGHGLRAGAAAYERTDHDGATAIAAAERSELDLGL
jgi:uncharacterized protein YukE